MTGILGRVPRWIHLTHRITLDYTVFILWRMYRVFMVAHFLLPLVKYLAKINRTVGFL